MAIVFLVSLITETPSAQLVSHKRSEIVSLSSSLIPKLAGSSTDKYKNTFSAAFLRTTGYLNNYKLD